MQLHHKRTPNMNRNTHNSDEKSSAENNNNSQPQTRKNTREYIEDFIIRRKTNIRRIFNRSSSVQVDIEKKRLVQINKPLLSKQKKPKFCSNKIRFEKLHILIKNQNI
jgi:hypothetical protein